MDGLKLLEAGNKRFIDGTPACGPYGPRVAEFASDPYPFAVVLACSDARVPVETIFDQVPGNLFVARVAGNFITREILASIELATDILKASLIVVLGHTHCGALLATLAYVRDGRTQRGHIPVILSAIAPSAHATKGAPGDWLENAILNNVARNVAALLDGSEVISGANERGEVRIVGGLYDVGSGKVTFL